MVGGLPGAPTIRRALPSDDAARVALRRASPLLLDGRSVEFESRSDDLLRAVAERYTTAVAEMDGDIVGEFSAALANVQLGQRAVPVAWLHRARVHPSVQQHGVGFALAARLTSVMSRWGIESPAYCMASENSHFEMLTANSSPMSMTIDLLELDCQQLALWVSPSEQCPVRDLSDLLRLMNRWNTGLGSSRGDLGTSPRRVLATRLGTPQYSVDNFFVSRAAAVGVMHGAEIHKDRSDARRVSSVLDWTVDPEDLEGIVPPLAQAALRALCAGDLTLSIAVPGGSRLSDVLGRFTRSCEHLHLWMPWVSSVEDLGPRDHPVVDRLLL